MSLEILFQDEDLVAVNKPSGLLVHPYKKETNESKCLLKDLRDQTGRWLYPVHRLDRPVSGIVLFGFNPDAVKELQSIWHSDKVRKFYLALARGRLKGPVEHSFPLLSEKKIPQEAFTSANPVELFERSTLVEVEIKTGRKHQIRRHFARSSGHLIGDRMYGKGPINNFYRDNFGIQRIFLHAHRLLFLHPSTKQEVCVDCPLPSDLEQSLHKMRLEKEL